MTSPVLKCEEPFPVCVDITQALSTDTECPSLRQQSLLDLLTWKHMEESHVHTWSFMEGPSDNDKQAAGKNIIFKK